MPGSGIGLRDRLAGAPISWGVCEIPDWGYALPAPRVLREMASLDLRGTELGPDGFLPADPDAVCALLQEHHLRLVGGFVFLVLHEDALAGASLATAAAAANRVAAAGGEVLVTAAATGSPDLSGRPELNGRHWRHLLAMLGQVDAIAEGHGLCQAFHPHAGTVVETAADVRRVLDGSTVALCFDTGHLAIGGTDSLALAREAADRIGHVHLKDVNPHLAARLRSGATSFQKAVQHGLFPPLGGGSIPVKQVVAALEGAGYRGWYVLEQDTALTADPTDLERPMADAQASLDYLREAARTPNSS